MEISFPTKDTRSTAPTAAMPPLARGRGTESGTSEAAASTAALAAESAVERRAPLFPPLSSSSSSPKARQRKAEGDRELILLLLLLLLLGVGVAVARCWRGGDSSSGLFLEEKGQQRS